MTSEPISRKKIEIEIQIEIENFANFNCAKEFGNNFVAFYRKLSLFVYYDSQTSNTKNESEKTSNAKCDKMDVKKLARKFSSKKSF